MLSRRSLARFARSLMRMRSLAAVAVLATGCAFDSNPPSRAPLPQQTYGVWEFDTLGELDQLLDVKGCEGWWLVEAFARGEKIIAIIATEGVEPPPANPNCRPTA